MMINLVSPDCLEELAELFDQYRVFYGQSSDLGSAKHFLRQRFKHQDSIIFIAKEHQILTGFTQLYPSFSSVSMKRLWILNDLFVVETHRRKGVAKSLMDAAEKFAAESGAVRLVLATQMTNIAAQKLYESRNYRKDEMFYHYTLGLV
uniref:GNAT family N-acetyltransferase n=1 Tax=Oscillatoriales cyanobacterium SpSt-402 TaxID=2282168 RepID=A0A832M2R0_9CYAN